MSTPFCVAYVTAPAGKKAVQIANKIVSTRLAACVNIVPAVRSIYWWKGKKASDKESLLIIKTRKALLKKLVQLVQRIHPYTVPEIIALPIQEGNRSYLQWLNAETR